MKTISINDSLQELIRAEQEEIAKHRWIESEKAGRDIGEQQALEDWLQHHFSAWASHNKHRAIEDALHAG